MSPALCSTARLIALIFATLATQPTYAQDHQASPRDRAGAVLFGQHCSPCHGVRLLKEDTNFDLVAYVKAANVEQFVRGAKVARGSMPSFARQLTDQELSDIYAYVKRGHTPDLNDVRMESNH